MDSLPNHFYNSSEIYTAEKEKLFTDQWLFICMQDEIAKPNDYYEVDWMGTPVVVHNFKGEVAAFINVCPHRFNKIQEHTKGNRPFFCAYHAWGFDAEGNCKIPNSHLYDESVRERKLIKLPLQNCGKFYFVNLNADTKTTLQDFLGELYNDLLQVSELLDRQINTSDIPHNCNWKFIVENALECLHCKFIHTESFFDLGFGGIPAVNTLTVNGCSRAEYPRSEKGKQLLASNKHINAFLNARVRKSDNYHHLFIFPNLLIGSVSYMNVYIGNVLPVSPTQATLRVRNYDAQMVDYNKNKGIFNYIMEEAINSNATILKEDKEVIENIQSGLSVYNYPATLSKEEFRIKEFQEEYLKRVHLKESVPNV